MSPDYNRLITLAEETGAPFTPDVRQELNGLLGSLSPGDIRDEHLYLLESLATIMLNTDNVGRGYYNAISNLLEAIRERRAKANR